MTGSNLIKLGGGVVLALLLFVALILAASELGGEVVKIYTTDGEGMRHETPVWLVEDAGSLWLRAGQPGVAWLLRIQDNPDLELERAGTALPYRAVLVPGKRDRINQLMAEKYGWAESLISLIHDEGAIVPIRLHPLEP